MKRLQQKDRENRDPMKASGKQVLLRVLKELSTNKIAEENLATASERLRAAMLMHGSTSDESLSMASRLKWASFAADGEIVKQGIATQSGGLLVADLFEGMLVMPELERFCQERYPGLTKEDYQAGTWSIWLVLSAVQMFVELLGVEVADDELDVEYWIQGYKKKLRLFISDMPQGQEGDE